MRSEPEVDKYFYVLGWCLVAIALVYLGLKGILHIDLLSYIPTCIFYRMTGYYCVGCGGTRAVLSFIRGDIIGALFYHPFVPYAFFVGAWFMVTQTLEKISRGKIKIAMHFRMIYVWIALALIVMNVSWKNAVLLLTELGVL